MSFKQAKWHEPLIFESGREGRIGFVVPEVEEDIKEVVGDVYSKIPESIKRRSKLELPSLSEVEVLRHYIRLSQMSYGVDLGPVPLGSCTMKYNPRVLEELASKDELAMLHPEQDLETVQGILEVLYKLERWLAEITGMDKGTLQPAAGAHGELTGALIIRKYHLDRGEVRDEMLIPDSAHGTNPASASMAGFRIVKIPTNDKGTIDIEALESAVNPRTAGIMLTNPNTLGLFEEEIVEIAKIVHRAGGLLYYDGANLNGIMGVVRPGDMGFDIVHINVHKTFATPHGGGGPGAGPVLVKKFLSEYLPVPTVEYDDERGFYYLDYDKPKSIGRVRAFFGNIIPLLKAFIYILALGPEGLREVAEVSVLNTNYFLAMLRGCEGYSLEYSPEKPRKHEVVLSAKPLTVKYGVTAEDVSKALLDRGFYAPTIYFPLIVEEALMVEFTESETLENIEEYARALKEIYEVAKENPESLKKKPENTSVGRLDLVKANHPSTVSPTFKVYVEKLKTQHSSGLSRSS